MITYAIRGQTTLMSSWEGAFPTLFPNGVGGHLPHLFLLTHLDGGH